MLARRHHTLAAGLVLAGLLTAVLTVPAAAQAPTVMVDAPEPLVDQTAARPVGSTVTLHYTGVDEDGPGGRPVRYRFLFERAWVDELGGYVGTRADYESYRDELVAFVDSSWSPWLPYHAESEQRRLTFPDLPARDDQDRLIFYLFAVQVMDTTGVVSLEREYGHQVVNFYVSSSVSPLVTVEEPYLGVFEFTGTSGSVYEDIVPGQELNFAWTATAAPYGSDIAAARWGWDVADPGDPNDPGWAVPPGDLPENWEAPPQTFSSGNHTLTIQVWDVLDNLTQATFVLSVVPIPDPAYQLPLLLVDDVLDRDSNAWPSEDGAIVYDNDVYRDAFWESVLDGPGGVVGFDPAQHVVDGEVDELAFRDLVNFRCVLWTARYTSAFASIIGREFRPDPGEPAPYNWLGAYQVLAGNLMLVGSRNENAFLAETSYTLPVVLDDATYPWRWNGLTAIDQMSPPGYQICGGGPVGAQDRRRECVGTKGVRLDPDFTDRYMAGSAAFEDTILTEPLIDWRDADALYVDDLQTFPFGGSDEFYDTNISPCEFAVTPQDCDGEPCAEPMFRAYSRLDWNRDRHQAQGDDAWPIPYFTPEELQDICGDLALDGSSEATLTDGVPVGFFAHKTESTKPSGRADVVWGFDPYRFDHAAMTEAVRWVLGEHFGLDLRP
jgi:hypothetical protein